MVKSTCIQNGCEQPEGKRSEGHCEEHYAAVLRARFPDVEVIKPGSFMHAVGRLWKDVEAVEETGCWEWFGHTDTAGYGVISVCGKSKMTHRFAWELHIGPITEGMFLDHLCHNKLCCNPEHLREVTPKQNTEHRAGKNPNNTSGRHGVTWRRDVQKWEALVHAGPKMHHVGMFDDLDEAAEAARLKRLELFTHNDRDRK